MPLNKFVFITGCNGQLGNSISQCFKNNNWHVFGLDLTKNKNPYLDGFTEGAVQNRDSFRELFNLAINRISNNVDLCLINNAGISVFTPSENRTYDEFLKVSEVNLFGPILGMTEFYKFHQNICKKLYINSNSQILNISSIYGLISPNKAIYTDTKRSSSEIYGATKAGLIQMTKYFASRYAEDNLRVNCIAPGGILNNKLQGPEFIKNYSNLVPMKRLCEDKEVSELIFSFVSGKFSYVTGQTIPIDGGMSSW